MLKEDSFKGVFTLLNHHLLSLGAERLVVSLQEKLMHHPETITFCFPESLLSIFLNHGIVSETSDGHSCPHG